MKSNKVPGAKTLTKLLESNPQPIFSNGAPSWYADFSNAVYTNMHSVASGSESVAAAISSVMAGWVADATSAHMVCPSLALAGLSGAALV